jgi:leucyl aminopeptidase
MLDMHMDMSGGAAVIHGMAAVARMHLPVNIVGLVPAVENMPSGTSYRPGDLLKTMSGKTIEVLNTDAEGRVILSDALYYGATKYKPGFMADFATLTGAAHVALGSHVSAVFSNREKALEKLEEIGKKSGDYVWRLPLWDEYLTEIKGVFGDIANAGRADRYGGAIQGAKFLEQFVENTPWAHLDIAPRMIAVDGEFLSKGATGVGVRYIVELAREYPNLKTE